MQAFNRILDWLEGQSHWVWPLALLLGALMLLSPLFAALLVIGGVL